MFRNKKPLKRLKRSCGPQKYRTPATFDPRAVGWPPLLYHPEKGMKQMFVPGEIKMKISADFPKNDG